MHTLSAIKLKGLHTDEDYFFKFYVLLDFSGLRQGLLFLKVETLVLTIADQRFIKGPWASLHKMLATAGAPKFVREMELFYLPQVEFYSQ